MRMTMIRWCGHGFLGALLLACGGTTSGATGGDGGGQVITPGSCTVVAGSYTMRFTLVSGTNCPAIPDEQTTLNGNEMLTGGVGGSMLPDGGGCSTDANASTCTVSTTCDVASGGLTEHFSLSFTYGTTSIAGQEQITESDPSAGFALSCTYDIVITKN